MCITDYQRPLFAFVLCGYFAGDGADGDVCSFGGDGSCDVGGYR